MNFENQADAEGQRGNMKVHIAGAERPACYVDRTQYFPLGTCQRTGS